MKILAISDILLDNEDKYLLDRYKWHLKDGKYLRTSINGIGHYMHHIILNSRKLIDHIDRNPLNNMKSNLRFATKSTNAMNTRIPSNNTSGIKGVSWNNKSKKWVTYININKKRLILGYFKEIKDAAIKRAEAELIYFKEFSNKDLIKQIYENFSN